MIRISITKSAEIGHCLPDHPIERNRRPHGHSILVTVTAEGPRDQGMVMDFDVFGTQIQAIVETIDHQFLNDTRPEIGIPTLENIAEYLGKVMALTSGERRIVSVRVDRPSCGQSAEWRPE